MTADRSNDRDRWRRVEKILDQALEAPAEELAALLDRACAGEADLRAEVEELLAAERQAGSFLEAPAAEMAATLIDEARQEPATKDGSVPRRLGPYRLIRRVGRGGMGEVFLARDTRLHREVAVKLLPVEWGRDPAARERFLREARAASALDDPHICTIHDVGEAADGEGSEPRMYIVMAFYEGKTLKDKLRRGRLSIEESVDVAIQVARGLARAHEAGIVHRDVKPANVMVTGRGAVKILDFGIAKIAGTGDLTRTGASLGTPYYMSPEQARGETVDARCDVWALGAMLYEMLAGRRPFGGDDGQAVIYGILNREPTPLGQVREDVPPELERVVAEALAKDPGNRYPNAGELLAALSAATATATAPTVAGLDDRRRRLVPHAATVTLALAVLAVLVFAWRGRGRGPSDRVPPTGDAIVASLPATPFEHYQQAMAALDRYYRPGYLERAEEGFQQALALDESYAPGYAGLALTHLQRYNRGKDRAWLDKAEGNARQALAIDDSLAAARVSLGLIELARGHHDAAREQLEEVLRLDPANAGAHRGLGDVHRAAGDLEAAEAAYRRALELRPEDMMLHGRLGTLYYRHGRYSEAEAAFSRALEIEPEEQANYKNLAAALHMQGRYAEAARLLQKALEIQPDGRVYTNLGTLYFFQGLYPQALSALKKAVDLGANDFRSWGNLGDAYRWVPGNEENAVDAFRVAIRLLREELAESPTDPALLGLLSEFQAKQGDRTAALQGLQQLGDRKELDAETLFNATQAAEIVGERELALGFLDRTLAAGYSLEEVRKEPELVELRKDPRFHRLVTGILEPDPQAAD